MQKKLQKVLLYEELHDKHYTLLGTNDVPLSLICNKAILHNISSLYHFLLSQENYNATVNVDAEVIEN
jgi:hypothetical protein